MPYLALTVIQQVSSEVKEHFALLTEQQLNMKPSADKWSIAQCLHHLIVTNETYYTQFDTILAGKHQNSFYQNIGFVARFMGKQMINDLGPERRKTFKNPPLFAPSLSNLHSGIVTDFLAHQKQLETYFIALGKLDLANVVISSPVTNFITYPVTDALKIIEVHELRHLAQAKEVKQLLGLQL